ncbi:oligosaccharide flippase family protein [Campylobacter concisus]|uniref:oligosaccharide flippase family protein n=1 Tax=Campylobacter concisus TaxID=199 RepID=UPI001883D78A|nr:oligosaccharide flippase family protein [Campylobacter concisus]MBE9869290.1 oligosaccharide flippase family protein [Campylobacter concisus]
MLIVKNKNLIKNLVSIMLIDVLAKSSSLFLLPIYLKLMTQEEFGIYSYAIGLSAFFTSIGSMGLYGAINRYFYDRRYSQNEVVSTLFSILVVSIVSFVFALASTIHVWRDLVFSSLKNNVIVVFVILSIFNGALVQFFMSFFYIDKRYKEIRNFNLARLVLVNCVSLGAMYLFSQNSVVERLSALIASELLVCMLFLKYILQHFSYKKFNKNLAKESLIFGYPLVLNAVLGFIYSFTDKYFIQNLFDFRLVGEYYFMFTFSSMFSILFSSIQNFWLPFFFNPANKHLLSIKIIQLISLLSILVIVYYFIVLFLLNFLFTFNIFNVAYKAGISYLWLLVFSQFILSVSSLLNNYFSLYNKTIYGLYVSLIMSFVSIFIMYFFINLYQVYGAAFAVLINSIISLMLTFVFVRYIKMRIHE